MMKLFRKESLFLWALFLIVLVHVLFMTYFFPHEWADTPRALSFIQNVASVVPVVANVIQHAPAPNTNYWGMFYAVFWTEAPFFLLLGFISSFFLNQDQYEKMVIQTSKTRLIVTILICFVTSLFEFHFPFLSFGFFVNQMSSFMPKLLLSWFATAGVLYYTSQVFGAFIIKSQLHKIQ